MLCHAAALWRVPARRNARAESRDHHAQRQTEATRGEQGSERLGGGGERGRLVAEGGREEGRGVQGRVLSERPLLGF